MDGIAVSNSPAEKRRFDSYDKRQLKRLGSFRELTRCGSLWDILLGRTFPDDCAFSGSSRFTWHG